MKTWADLEEQWDKRFAQLEGQEHKEYYDRYIRATNQIQQVVSDARQRADGKYDIYSTDALYQIPFAAFTPARALGRPVEWMCPKGHITKKTIIEMAELLTEEDQPACGVCRRYLNGVIMTNVLKARVRMTMMLDEQGCEAFKDTYTGANVHMAYEVRGKDLHGIIRPKNAAAYCRPYDHAPADVWIAYGPEHAFLWFGTRPVVENPMINKWLFEPADAGVDGYGIELYYEDEHLGKKGYTYASGLRNAIEEVVEEGAKVLNMALNPQYKEPGVYTWGRAVDEDAALADWMTSIAAEWKELG